MSSQNTLNPTDGENSSPIAPATADSAQVTPENAASAAPTANDGAAEPSPQLPQDGSPAGATSAVDNSAEMAETASESGTSAEPAATSGEAAPSTSDAPAEAATSDATSVDAAPSSGDPIDQGPAPDASAEAGDGTKKKRRRRRRKKKKGEGEAAAASGSERPERNDKKPATDRAPFHVGEEVFGRVTAVLDEAIMVDLSGKALGIFDRLEMEADDLVPSEGDRFVARVHQDGGRGGLLVLTRKPLREEEAKPKVEEAAKSGELIDGLITGVIKGGVDVDINGLRAFAPASGMDLHPQNANFASLVGQRMKFKVTRFDNHGRDVVVTRRPMLEAEAHERRKRALGILEEGQVMKGVVRTVVDWGVFVAMPDAENLEGLVHVSEASHDPRTRLLETFKPGDKLEVKITKIDERGKIWLSRKALVPDPWKEAKEKYPAGTKLTTKITRVEAFGAFCQLEGVEGLIHIADLRPTRIEDINEVIKPGDELEVVVHQFDLKNHKVALHPALQGEQADEKPQKIARNAALDVEVIKAEAGGVAVRVLGTTGRAARGFIPAAQTGTQRGTDLRKHFPAGHKLRATVIDLDPRRGEPKLSVRRLEENEERAAHREYRKKLAAEGGFGTLGDLLRKQLQK